MTIERLGLHLGEHDRALAELMQTRNLPKKLDELAARVEEIAGGAPAGVPSRRRARGARSAASGASEPSTGEVKALMRRVEDAEVASQADREKLMNRLERMASSIDWRLQRLEATETTQEQPGRGGPGPTVVLHAPGRIRTFDLALRRRALYPLSYGRSGGQCTRAYSSPDASTDVRPPPPGPRGADAPARRSLQRVRERVVLPFTLIYLHNVRGISLAVAGLVIATNAGVALVAGPLSGPLVDGSAAASCSRPRSCSLQSGSASTPSCTRPGRRSLAATVTGIGNGFFWPAQSTLLVGLTPPDLRHITFGMQRV